MVYRILGTVLLMGYIGFVMPLIPIASDDIRLVNVFSIDEADITTEIWNIYQVGFLRKPAFKYGGAFYYPPVLALQVWSLFAPVSEQVLIIIVRLFCTLAGMGCLWGIYRLGSMVFNRAVGLIAVFLMSGMPLFLRWSVESHPDLPQLFWLICSLLFMAHYAQQFDRKAMMVSAFCAGLAFGTKFGGIFLMPVLVLAVFMSPDYTQIVSNFKERRRWGGIAGMGLCFVGAFAISNPFALLNASEFFQSLMKEKDIMAFGHRVQASSDAWAWVNLLIQSVGGFHLIVLVCVGSIWAFASRKNMNVTHGLLVLWVVFFMIYLGAEANLKRPRHLLPIIPVIVVFVAWAYNCLGDWIQEKFRNITGIWWVGVAGVVAFSMPQILESTVLFKAKQTRELGSKEIEVGRWLSEMYSEDVSIVFDAYAYVPSKFQNTFRTFGMTYQLVNHFEPDLLIVRDAIAADFSNLAEASVVRMGAEAFRDSHFFYRFLQAGQFVDYRLLRDFETVAVYERILPKTREKEPFRKFWRSLVLQEVEGTRFGQVEALWIMSEMHRKYGDSEEAAKIVGRAQTMKNYVRRIYTYGVHLLGRGDIENARRTFDHALVASKSKPIVFQIGMQEDLALKYFNAGFFVDAIAVSLEATRLAPERSLCAFVASVAYVGSGQAQKGRKAFAQSVSVFGATDRGRELLESLLLKDKEPEVVVALLNAYYNKNPN